MKEFFYYMKNERSIIGFFTIEILFFISILLTQHFIDSSFLLVFIILLFTLGVLSFYFLYQVFRSLSYQARQNAEKEILLRQKEIQNEHILASMQASKDLDALREKLFEIAQQQETDTNTDYRALANQLIEEYASDVFIKYCPNKVIDAILYNKTLIMRKLHIKYAIQAIVPENIPVSNYAIMSVLTNLLDNAIEANQNVHILQRRIEVEIFIQANYLIIRVQNAYNKNTNPKIVFGLSTKKDFERHGFGLQIIQQICKEHNGEFTIEMKEDKVYCAATLKLEETN